MTLGAGPLFKFAEVDQAPKKIQINLTQISFSIRNSLAYWYDFIRIMVIKLNSAKTKFK